MNINYELIEEARKNQGISIVKLSAMVGINRSSYYRWINGDVEAPINKIFELCVVLGIDINTLMVKGS